MITLMANRKDPDQKELVWVCAVCLGLIGRHLVFEILEHLCFVGKAAVLLREKCHNQSEHPRERVLEISLSKFSIQNVNI